MSTTSPVVARYLDQLAAALAECGLPEDDRREIAREIESHLADAAAAGTPIAEGIRRLGAPRELARAYAVELLLGPVPAMPRRPWRRVAAAASSLLSYAVAAAVGLVGAVCALAGVLGAALALVAPWLPLDPTLRAGLPQAVVLLASLLLGGLGALLLRLLRHAWRIARARPNPKTLIQEVDS